MSEVAEIKVSGTFDINDADGKPTGETEKREAAFKWTTPGDLDEMREMWGDDTVYTLAMQKGVIQVQDKARRELGTSKGIDSGQYLNYVPSVGRRGPSKPRKPESLEKDFEKLDEADQLALIERLRAKMAGGNGQAEAEAEAEPAGKKGK